MVSAFEGQGDLLNFLLLVRLKDVISVILLGRWLGSLEGRDDFVILLLLMVAHTAGTHCKRGYPLSLHFCVVVLLSLLIRS
jgi:hypothetical protein